MLLEGAGRVYWTESESYTAYETRHVNGRSESHPVTRTRTVVYSATEKYVSHKISLAGDGRNLMELPRGTLVYPFQFVLPANCPSSFTSKIGLVSYFLEAELRRPLLKPNKRTALPFTVNGIFDLNTERGAKQAREIEKVKGSNFCVCRKGQLGFVLKLPRRSGFVSGETLDFTAEVSNGSNKKIKRMKATLYQFTTFHANGKTRTETKAICQVQGPEVDVGEHEMWVPNNLVIPALPPTKLGGLCRIIDIQYCICCELKISGLTMSLSGQLPVLIGTIPLRSTFDELRCNTHTPLQEPSHVSPPGIGFHLPGSSNSNFSPGFSGAATTNKKSPYNAVDSTVPSAPFLAEYPDLRKYQIASTSSTLVNFYVLSMYARL